MTMMKSYWSPAETGEVSPATDGQQGRNSSEDVHPDPGLDVRAAQGNQGTSALIPEALPNIRLLVNHELPDGSGNEHNITFDPRNTVSQLRATMEAFSGIPQENIFFIFKMKTLDDSLSLYAQDVGSWDCITMRDTRQTYPYPY
ncbi:hypothetical protein ElyMa_006425600 [Elysia marginata]|uniref:Ubiquitin-like domain-containing protein n=1 Tax=Elysia marginata TaxID=1093978 RepID=A0AAV4HW16_9GAST|nr:hypothetical protein ElyMa_006425600 [Elysia marginata]